MDRECYVFMYARPWQEAVDFYSNLVNGCVSLSSLFGTEAGQLQVYKCEHNLYLLSYNDITALSFITLIAKPSPSLFILAFHHDTT